MHQKISLKCQRCTKFSREGFLTKAPHIECDASDEEEDLTLAFGEFLEKAPMCADSDKDNDTKSKKSKKKKKNKDEGMILKNH